jgi:hypothetical protein
MAARPEERDAGKKAAIPLRMTDGCCCGDVWKNDAACFLFGCEQTQASDEFAADRLGSKPFAIFFGAPRFGIALGEQFIQGVARARHVDLA